MAGPAMRALVVALLVAVASGRLLAPPTSKAATHNAKADAGAKSSPVTAKNAKDTKTVTVAKNCTVVGKTNASKKPTAPAKPLTAEDQVQRLQQGLSSISKLREMFVSKEAVMANNGASKFATGAMSTELSKQDSSVWAAISSMVGMAESVSNQMKNVKTKEEKQKLMDGLESQMNDKAQTLSKVEADVSQKQRQQDEEYILGLLNMHKDWDLKQQLNATAVFMKDSPVLAALYKNHTNSSLAPQLAKMMDAEKGTKAVVAKKAVKMFLQLAQSVRLDQ